MPRIPKNTAKEDFLLELKWQQDRKRIKDAKKVRRLIVQKTDKTFRLDLVKIGAVHLVCVLQVHAKSLGRVKGTQYDIHTLCGEDGGVRLMDTLAHLLKNS